MIYLNSIKQMYKLLETVLPFKGAISVLHVKVTDSPSLTVADCGNVANAGLLGSSF